MLKNQQGQALVEFAISIVLLFLFIFGLICTALWGTAGFLAQEIAHEVAREYAVSNDDNRAINVGKTYISRWGYIFVQPNSTIITVSKADIKAKVLVTVKPRIGTMFAFNMPSISKYSEATLEHYIRHPEEYAGGE